MPPSRQLVPPNPNFAAATRQFLMAMPIAQHFGFAITDVGPGRFEITQPFRHELSYQERVFQAGPIGTLADMAAACASATMLPEGLDRVHRRLHPQTVGAGDRGEARHPRPHRAVWTDALGCRRRCLCRRRKRRGALRHGAGHGAQSCADPAGCRVGGIAGRASVTWRLIEISARK
jgi:acyl-coenzyme A thioesterase PaaI-like protein